MRSDATRTTVDLGCGTLLALLVLGILAVLVGGIGVLLFLKESMR